MDSSKLRRGAAALACTASLAATATALAPGTAVAAGAKSCGSRTISVSAKGGKAVEVPVSRITVEGGATCKEAIAVIGGALKKQVPHGWTVREGSFKVPRGLTAQIATKGAKTVKYETVGS